MRPTPRGRPAFFMERDGTRGTSCAKVSIAFSMPFVVAASGAGDSCGFRPCPPQTSGLELRAMRFD
jgi:hypothetical protein